MFEFIISVRGGHFDYSSRVPPKNKPNLRCCSCDFSLPCYSVSNMAFPASCFFLFYGNSGRRLPLRLEAVLLTQ
jgi:hypothetical protein